MSTARGISRWASRTKTRRRGPNRPREAERWEDWFEGEFWIWLRLMRQVERADRKRRDALVWRARQGDLEAAQALLAEYKCRIWTAAECHTETQRRQRARSGRGCHAAAARCLLLVAAGQAA